MTSIAQHAGSHSRPQAAVGIRLWLTHVSWTAPGGNGGCLFFQGASTQAGQDRVQRGRRLDTGNFCRWVKVAAGVLHVQIVKAPRTLLTSVSDILGALYLPCMTGKVGTTGSGCIAITRPGF